jgi:hypothetical protein
MDMQPPNQLLAEAERAVKLVAAYYEQAGDDASLFEAGAVRWRLIDLLGTIATALESIAEWEPRDFDKYEAMERADVDRIPDLYDGIAVLGREAFERSRDATSNLYVMATALRRVQALLRTSEKLDLNSLDLREN